jgi:hypothetical protein
MPAQFAEKLLQIGERNLLALADSRERDRTVVLAQSQRTHSIHALIQVQFAAILICGQDCAVASVAASSHQSAQFYIGKNGKNISHP